jgi:hypothetical protein
LDVCAGLQDVRNLTPAAEHRAIAASSEQTTPATLGAKSWREVLQARLGISGKEANRRCAHALELGPRISLTGEVLAPKRKHVAAAQAGGWLTPDHITELLTFFKKCHDWISLEQQSRLEQRLVAGAVDASPETVRQAADHALYLLDQDGPVPPKTYG